MVHPPSSGSGSVWGCAGREMKGCREDFFFFYSLKTQEQNIHAYHKEQNQALSCNDFKKNRSVGYGQVFGYLFLITHSGFVFSFLWVYINAVFQTGLKPFKRGWDGGCLKGSLKDSLLLTVLFCLYLISLMVFRWL